MKPNPIKLVVLISGSGSNMQAIANAIQTQKLHAQIALVISDRAKATGLKIAQQMHIDTWAMDQPMDRDTLCQNLATKIAPINPDFIVLAGFMRILNADFVQKFAGKIINIHPSLLPKYPGLNTHCRALEAQDQVHGSSVHFVTETLDGGPLIARVELDITSLVSSNSEGKRQDHIDLIIDQVKTQEHKLYPLCLIWLQQAKVKLESGQVMFDGQPMPREGITLNTERLKHQWEQLK